MSKPVVLIDAGELVGLSGSAEGDVLKWDAGLGQWYAAPGGGTGTVTSVTLDTGDTGLLVDTNQTTQTITTDGTFTLGGTLVPGHGGTGLVAPIAADAGKVLTAKADGTYELATPAASGVTSLAGTTDQVNVSSSTGAVTLSLPQSIANTSSPTFAGLTVGSLSGLLRATAGVLAGSATVALDSEVSGTLSLANGGTGKDLSSITAGEVIVGQVGGGSVDAVTVSKDATLGADGALTVVGLQGRALSSSAPIAGQSLVWSSAGSGAWVPGDTASGGSGGGGVVYFMNAGTTRTGGGLPAGSYQLGRTAEVAPNPITVTNVPTNAWTRVAGFVTDAGDPTIVTLPAGIWDFNIYATSTANSNDMLFRLSFFEYNGSTDPELGSPIATTLSTAIYDPSVAVQYQATFNIPQTAFTAKRIYLKLEAFTSVASKNVTFDFGNNYASHVHTTVPSVTGSGFVKVLNDVIVSTGQLVNLGDSTDVGSSVLNVGNGGTGASSLTQHQVLVGNGTNAVTSYALNDGQVLIGQTGGAPAAATLTAGTGVGITNGTNSISISIGQAVANTDSPTFAGLTLSGLTGYLKGNASSALTASTNIPAGDLSGQVALDKGGTNANLTAIAGGVVYSGASAFAITAAGTTGQPLVSNGASAPAFGTIGGAAFGSQSPNTVLAAPDGSAGNPSFRPLVAGDIPSLSGVYLPIAGGTLTGQLITSATATLAGLTIGSSALAPTTLANGDIWYQTNTNTLYARLNGVSQAIVATNPSTNTAIVPAVSGGGGFSFSISAGASAGVGGTGGALTLAAGQGGSGGTGGALTLRAGQAGSGGAAGAISIGATNTASIGIGAAGVTTTFSGRVVTPALTASAAGFNIAPTSATPTTLSNGDMWVTSANLFVRINGTTQTLAPLASPTFTGTPTAPTASSNDNTTQIATTAFVTSAVSSSSGAPYDLPFEIPGTPEAAVKRVVNFEAVRAFVLATSGHQGGQVTAPSGNYVCTVKKNATTLGTITFAAGGFSSNITATLADRTFAATDVLIVETPSANLGIDTPFATFFMTLV